MYRFSLKDSQFLPHAGIDLQFDLIPGEILVITGPNGIGKTSAMHRLYQQQSDLISIVEQQNMDYFYDRSIGKIKNLFLSSSEVDVNYFEMLWNKFNLHLKENRLHSELSGGESQALKICLGLSIKRNIFFLDEPTQYLDKQAKEILSHFISELLEKQNTFLVIEHDLEWMKSNFKTIQIDKAVWTT